MASPESRDVVQEGLNFLIDFWKNKPKVQGLLKSQLREIQEIEDVAFQLLNDRNVNDAVGVQLDVIGNLVGEKREGRNDEPYRQAILLRISLNRSDGTPPVILDILNLISGSPIPNIFEHYPASFHAYVDRGASHSLAATLKQISVAGVDTRLVFDWGGDSFIGCEIERSDELFQLEDLSTFSTDNTTGDPLFSSEGYTPALTSENTFLPEMEEELLNPPCEIFDGTEYSSEIGVFNVGEGSILQFEDGSIFQWEILEVI